MATWTQIRDGIQGAITTASGLSASKVIWRYGNAMAPAEPYVTLSLGASLVQGIDWIDAETDLLRAAGQEIALTAAGFREVALQIQCFTTSTADSSDALALAETIRGKLLLPATRDALAAVGVVPFAPDTVNYVPDVPTVNFRGRATLDVRCSMPAQAVVEYCGYIASIEGTETTTGGAIAGDTVRTFTAP